MSNNQNNESKLTSIIAVICAIFLGAGAMYGIIKLNPAVFIKQIT